MPPLPAADPNFNAVINSQPSSTYSCSVFYSGLNPPSTTDPVEASTVQTTDWEALSIPPATLRQSQLPLSTELEWKPLVPETETLLEISDREATDEFVEFVSQSQWWDNNRKRSGIINLPLLSPPVAPIPTLLTYNFKTVQDQGRPATAMETAPVGEYHSSHFQELFMVIFIVLIAIFWIAAVMLATNRIERWLRCRLTSSQGELGEDEECMLYYTLSCIVPCSLGCGFSSFSESSVSSKIGKLLFGVEGWTFA
ncbi:hypothetical protein B9Z19DRAFT_1062336 [Tuber borchii]|uniref:Uncharacterized protein n=1 Tax=Tuber borchii TaxID=42251 RepID=A0A2T7A2A3_TUBBO|nr:hypothetical protein B9Z19DRAFT_1062336 [Tuber borchii]